MSKRFIIMAVAIAVAAGVLGLAYLADSGPSQPSPDNTPGHVPDPTIDPNWTGVGTIDRTKGQGGLSDSSLTGVGQTQFTRLNERGLLEVYKGDPITALPGGWWQVGKPEFIYHLASNRAFRLTADHGKLYAPAEPRSGSLTGHVKVEYFDTGSSEQLVSIQDASPDLQFRMLMDDVLFDRDLFRLETDGPFHMTSPQFDYVGEHLRLVYTDVNQRIETLQVQKSKWLRIHPQSRQERQDRSDAIAAQSKTPAQTDAPVAAAQPKPDAVVKPASHKPVQFYRAVFPQNVRLVSRQVQVQCDALSLVFSLQDEDGGQTELLGSVMHGSPVALKQRNAPQLMAKMLSTTGTPLYQAMLQMAAWSMLQTGAPVVDASQPQDRLSVAAREFANQSLAPLGEDDIHITWDGPLSVEPVSTQVLGNIKLAGAEDIYVFMEGRPVVVTGERGEVVKSASLAYLVSAGTLKLLGDGVYPVEMDSPQLGGVLVADNFTLDQNQGTGRVKGPGILRAYSQATSRKAAAAENTGDLARELNNQERLPRDFAIGWRDALELSFYKRPGTELSSDASQSAPVASRDAFGDHPVQISAIQNAVFQGDVSVSHPRFDMRADQMSLGFGQPGQSSQAMESIQAMGHVRVGVNGQLPSDQASIAAGTMTVDLGMDAAGHLEPRSLLFKDNVVATTMDGTLKTRQLTAILSSQNLKQQDPMAMGQPGREAPRVVHLTPQTGVSDSPVSTNAFTSAIVPAMLAPSDLKVLLAAPVKEFRQPPIKQLIAQDDVEIEMTQPVMRISANKLVSDFGPLDTQVQLDGVPQQPVRVLREGMVITGPRVVFTQNARTLHIPGSGMMAFYNHARANQPDATATDAPVKGEPAPTLVNVTWSQAMHFDDRGGAAQFLGNVLVQGSQGSDSSRLSCQDLRLEFVRTPEASFGNDMLGKLSDQDNLLQNIRQVRSIVARENAVFEAQSMADRAEGEKPQTRIRMVGELMTFDGQRERVNVFGPGTMLIEDYRDARKPAPGKVQTPAVMVGRGASLFRWAGSLVLDAAYNDMIITDQVQMIHAPVDDTKRFQLDCSHLVADMENTGGLGAIATAATPQVKAIFGDGTVRLLTDDKQVTTDHLEYDGKKELVLLTADPGKFTTISEPKSPVPLTFRQIKWYLESNRFEGLEPGRGMIPIMRDPRRN